MRSNRAPLLLIRFNEDCTSLQITTALSANLHNPKFFFITLTALGSPSIKVAVSAPLLSASRPIAPVPAKRSNTFLKGNGLGKILKIASLTLSVVGLMCMPLKEASLLPLAVPPIIRIC